MFSLLLAVTLLAAPAEPHITFERPKPGITQIYKGDYDRVVTEMNRDFLRGRYPGFANFSESHNFRRNSPYTVNIRLNFSMPVWLDKDKKPKEQQRRWDTMYRIMWDHENLHLDINEEAIRRGFLKLVNKSPSEAETILEKSFKEAVDLNKNYDILTNHSRSQQKFTDLPGDFKRKFDTLREIRAKEYTREIKFRF